MKLGEKLFCRAFQGIFRAALPVLPYRDPQILKEVKMISVNNGSDLGFSGLRESVFYGCATLKHIKFGSGVSDLYKNALYGTGIEVLKVTGVKNFDKGPAFAGMAKLKQLFISNDSLKMDENTFKELACDVDIYFYEHTREEVIKLIGNDSWLTGADAKAHFYFKDTMPEGVEIPA